MNLLIVAVSVVSLVFVWVAYGRQKSLVDRFIRSGKPADRVLHYVRDLQWQLVVALLVTVVAVASIWFWGYEGFQRDRAQQAIEAEWFASFEARHRSQWTSDCRGLFTLIDSGGRLFSGENSYSAAWCDSLWSAPQAPSDFRTEEYAQPENQDPQAYQSIFSEVDFLCYGEDCLTEAIAESWTWDQRHNSGLR